MNRAAAIAGGHAYFDDRGFFADLRRRDAIPSLSRSDIEGAAKDVGEAQDVVDLVRLVGPSTVHRSGALPAQMLGEPEPGHEPLTVTTERTDKVRR